MSVSLPSTAVAGTCCSQAVLPATSASSAGAPCIVLANDATAPTVMLYWRTWGEGLEVQERIAAQDCCTASENGVRQCGVCVCAVQRGELLLGGY